MGETKATPSNEPEPTWSITKSEWDGYQRASPLDTLPKRVIVGAIVVLGLVFMAVPILLPGDVAGPGLTRLIAVIGASALAVTILQVAFSFWWSRRWDRLRPMIWDANGCVCPWCKVRADTAPCPNHGFTRAQHRFMLDYWESLPVFAFGDRARALIALRNAAPYGSTSWRLVGVVQRLRLQAEVVAHDPNSTPLTRVRAAIPRALVTAVFLVVLFAVALAAAPRMIVGGMAPAFLPWLLVGPIMVAIGPLWRSGRPRCSACNHLCASDQPTVCTECGADLLQPAAVTRLHRSSPAALLILALPLGLVMGMMFFQDQLIRLLPSPVRNAYWTNIRPPMSYWQGLTPATMTQVEIDEAANLLIECARPNRTRPLFDSSFLCNAERAGKLTPELLERVARATVEATLEIKQDGNAVVATVQPAFGELILGPMKTPRLVFGGVSLDDGPWTKGANWSLFMHDLDSFWRTSGQLRALPESQLVFTGRIEDAPKGMHAIRARCWIVIHGAQWERYTPTFDATGALLPPAGALVYPLDLKTTIEIE
jgi:hypothetical protein